MPTIIAIAKAAHEVNRAYCKSIGDNSQPVWEEAPEWQQKSAITGVEFNLNNPDATPESSHESWLKEKADDGWKYGEVKDAEKKEHPCFLPYDKLPKEQRVKDYLFKSVVDSFRDQVNERVVSADIGRAEGDFSAVHVHTCSTEGLPMAPLHQFPEPLISPHNPAIGEIVKAAIGKTDFCLLSAEHREVVVNFVKSLTSLPEVKQETPPAEQPAA